MSGAARDALGVNGLGRIGKLTLWHHVARRHFPRLVVNLGRGVGRGLESVCDVIEHDTTYGPLHRFLHGLNATPCVRIADRDRNIIEVDGVPVTILQDARDPRDIAWRDHGVRVVVDTTGAFDDPTRPVDHPKGSLRGHLWAGAEKVIYSAAFKAKQATPDDVVTLVYGINHEAFDPGRHHLISAASCTTTALAHMVKPLLDSLGPRSLMTASMSTIHAATNSQSLLDSVPAAGTSDMRKTRSALNSIILTSTNAATALEQAIPDIGAIGFMADSVRIPLPTESLIILNITVQSPAPAGDERPAINRDTVNGIYREAAGPGGPGLIAFSERQNVPSDVSGMRAAVVIESVETHTRTGFVTVDLGSLPGVPAEVLATLDSPEVRVPVTHAKIFGWYDNEYGSYTNMLGDLTCHVADRLD